jgi:hypothetical protein
MRGSFSAEPDPLDITVTAEVVGRRHNSVVLHAVVEDGTGADGGDIEVQVSGSAASSYGLDACIDELESFLNRTLRPAYRLSAALAMGAQGALLVVTTADEGPRVLVPAAGELAA